MANSATKRAAARKALVALAESCDVRVEITHGMPYDPQQSLVARFGGEPRSGEPEIRAGNTAELQNLVRATARTTDEAALPPLYASIQRLLDEQALVVPLYVPHRVAVHTAAVGGVVLPPDVYRVDLDRLHWRRR